MQLVIKYMKYTDKTNQTETTNLKVTQSLDQYTKNTNPQIYMFNMFIERNVGHIIKFYYLSNCDINDMLNTFIKAIFTLTCH